MFPYALAGEVMAAAPTNIVNDINTKVTDAVNSMTSNGSNVIAKVMTVAGGLIITGCIVLLVWRKVAPQTQIGQSFGGNGTGSIKLIWVFAFMLVGLCLILPSTIIPWVASILAVPVQACMNIFDTLVK